MPTGGWGKEGGREREGEGEGGGFNRMHGVETKQGKENKAIEGIRTLLINILPQRW